VTSNPVRPTVLTRAILLVGAGLIAGLGPFPARAGEEPTAPTTGAVPAPRKLVLTGEFHPRALVKVFAKVSGTVVWIKIREGQFFKAGEVLARIDPVEYELGVEQASAVLARAVARLKAMEAGGRVEEIDRAKSAIDSADAVTKNARATFERMAGLLAKGGVSQQACDQARRELDVALSGLNQARRTYDLVRVGPRAEEKSEARAEVERCRADLKLSQLRLEYTKVRAPFDGAVAIKTVDEGAFVLSATSPNAPAICTYADTTVLRALVDLPERDLCLITPHQKARISIQAVPDRTFEGTVVNVFPFVEERTRTGKVEIEVPNPTHMLLAGMFVTAELDATVGPMSVLHTIGTRIPTPSPTPAEGAKR
jgi:multidrug resistance efflux pump